MWAVMVIVAGGLLACVVLLWMIVRLVAVAVGIDEGPGPPLVYVILAVLLSLFGLWILYLCLVLAVWVLKPGY